MANQKAPPGEGGAHTPASADHTITTESTPTQSECRSQSIATVRLSAVASLRRRRAASWRLPVLDSGRSDPWYYGDGPELRGYEAAAHHLLGNGLTPAPNLPALRAMRSCGGAAQRAAEVIADAWELTG